MLGKIVKVIVRNISSKEKKTCFIQLIMNKWKGIIVEDAEKQDAYILDIISKPIKEFTDKVIAVIHRFDDVEEKLVVVPTDVFLTKKEIKTQVDFQECFFKTEIKCEIT